MGFQLLVSLLQASYSLIIPLLDLNSGYRMDWEKKLSPFSPNL